jgi:hypothetical protein
MNRIAIALAALTAFACSDSTGSESRNGLYVIHDDDEALQRMDPGTLALTTVGALGVTYDFGDCAWNPDDEKLYMTEGRGSNSLYTVDLTTGAATLVGVHGLADVFALAYHPPSNSIVGVAGDKNLYHMNLATGAATLIGATGTTYHINGLVWDSARNQLVGLTANFTAASLYTVNVTTGEATLLAAAGAVDNNGLAYDPTSDRFLAVDYQGSLFQYNPTDGYARTTRGLDLGTHSCIAYVP